LEQRQLLANIPIGDLPLGYRDEFAIPGGTNTYSFTLAQATTVDAIAYGGSVTLKRNGVSMMSGTSISRPVAAGNYSLEVSGLGGSSLLVKTSTFSPPTRLEAEVWSGDAIRLNWDDNTDDEVAYRIDRWTRNGWRRSRYLAADATATVIQNLVPGYATTYRVSAVDSAGDSLRSANIVTATTNSLLATKFYRIKSITYAGSPEAGWTLASQSLPIDSIHQRPGFANESKWIPASDWKTVVNAIVYGSVVITKDDASTVTHLFNNGEFKLGVEKDIAAAYAGNNLSTTGTRYVIALEDSYGAIDRDYDDFLWVVEMEEVAPDFDDIRLKRDVEETSLFAEDGGGSIGKGDTYDVKTFYNSPNAHPEYLTWELWDTDGTDELRAVGAGDSFSRTLTEDDEVEDDWFVRVYLDTNFDGQFDSGEPVVDNSFASQRYTVRPLTFAQASNVATETNATLDAKLADANALVNIRHSAVDRRATVRFTRSGNIATYTHDADHPSIIYNNDQWNALHANVNADVKIVKEILVQTNGDNVDPGVILGRCEWDLSLMGLRSGFSAHTFIHEAGHGVDLVHRTDDVDAVMFPNTAGAGNVINDDEREAYE